MKKLLALCSLLLTPGLAAGLPLPAGSAPSPCTLAAEDRAWLQGALDAWEAARRDALRLPPGPLPWLVLFDARCVWHVGPDPSAPAPRADGAPASEARLTHAGAAVPVRGLAHGGSVPLPDGGRVPPRVVSFAATYQGGEKPYLVMSLPTVWRAEPRHAADPHLDRLLRGVFVHEMTHTAQARAFGRRLDELAERHGLGDELDDDVVQRRFGTAAGFREAYEAERDLLYRAAGETDPGRRRALAADALARMSERRARYFTGADTLYAELEDLFLTLEGAANWAAYRAAVAEGMSEADALALIRRGGRFWSQDQGLALFLAADAVVPGWQARAFGAEPVSVREMLAAAVR